jgi:metal-responsive CopG/Arc/MetJ family transcriptional regulator
MAVLKLELDSALLAKVQKHADEAGYSSPQEFVQHLIEKELAKVPEEGDGEEAARKLKGIGYLDFGADI